MGFAGALRVGRMGGGDGGEGDDEDLILILTLRES
jgi:hypothetical protein